MPCGRLLMLVAGCIRLWDVRLAADDENQGKVLAQCDYDVSTFCLGDVHNGEFPIIVYVN